MAITAIIITATTIAIITIMATIMTVMMMTMIILMTMLMMMLIMMMKMMMTMIMIMVSIRIVILTTIATKILVQTTQERMILTTRMTEEGTLASLFDWLTTVLYNKSDHSYVATTSPNNMHMVIFHVNTLAVALEARYLQPRLC